MRQQHIFLFLLVTLFFFGGCTSRKKLMYLANLDTTSIQQFHEMDRPNYQIQYQDILYINISTLNEEMNTLLNPLHATAITSSFREESNIYVLGYTVSESGTITLPILGEITIYGLTVDKVKQSIQDRANNYLKDAIVIVKLLSFKFTVLGEVSNPGTYTNYNNQLTVLDAIGRAGDITDFGNRARILVIRPTNQGSYTYWINVQDKNLLQSQGYFLLPNDIVIVEPIKSKPFQINIPTMTVFLATVTTLVLLLSFIRL